MRGIHAAVTLFAWYIISVIATEEIIVQTKYGKLRGTRRQKMKFHYVGGDVDFVDEFLGVPYAKPPVGELRLTAPVPPCSWDGVRNATSQGSICPQPKSNVVTSQDFEEASEDCLFLDIYTPVQNSSSNVKSYPVMVFIHGGSYGAGSGKHYTGYILAHHQVVVVSINYRLHFLGFFTSADISAPGNYGFLDQIEALKWIQENIAAFNGDPRKVTIFGNSAGGSSVGLHLVSPASKGLFNGAILQSGSALSIFANQAADKKNALVNFANKMFAKFGCNKPNTWNSVECLKKMNATKLIAEDEKPKKDLNPMVANSMPWIDGAVIPDSPETLFEQGVYNKVSVMIGTVKNDMSINVPGLVMGMKDSNASDGLEYDSLVGGIRGLTKAFGYQDVVVNATVDQYTPGDKSNVWKNFEMAEKFMTDLLMVAPSVKLANILAKHGTTVYEYMFDHKFKPDGPTPILSFYGVYHQIELNYIFGAPFFNKRLSFVGNQSYSEQDRDASRLMMVYWSNFAKYGNPCGNTPSSCPWKPFKLKTADYMPITSSYSEMKTNLHKETVEFWNKKVPELIKKSKEKKKGKKVGVAPNNVGTNIIAGVAVGIFFLGPLLICNLCYCYKQNKGRNIDYQPQ